MERAGGNAIDFNRSNIQIGDIVVVSLNNTNARPLIPEQFSFIREFQYDAGGFLTTMNEKAGAGFYATDIRGPLPFVTGIDTEEKYFAYQVIR